MAFKIKRQEKVEPFKEEEGYTHEEEAEEGEEGDEEEEEELPIQEIRKPSELSQPPNATGHRPVHRIHPAPQLPLKPTTPSIPSSSSSKATPSKKGQMTAPVSAAAKGSKQKTHGVKKQPQQPTPPPAAAAPTNSEVAQSQGIQGPSGRFRGETVGASVEEFPATLQALFERIPLETMMIENWVRKRLVLVGNLQPLDKALQRLNRHKISALPVINEETNKITGVLDSQDVVSFLSSILSHQISMSQARWDFNLQTTGELIKSSTRPAIVLSHKSSMFDGLKELAKGYGRVIVVDRTCDPHKQTEEESDILGLFTQSDVIRFLANNPFWMNVSPISQKTLQELKILENPTEKIVTIEQTSFATDAFRKISDERVTGLAIIDSDGVIVGSITAANIRGVSRRNFQLLRRPLFEFLQRDRRRGWWTMPVCVQETDTIEKCIFLFTCAKVHHLFVLDESGKPKNVVTLTDILKHFV